MFPRLPHLIRWGVFLGAAHCGLRESTFPETLFELSRWRGGRYAWLLVRTCDVPGGAFQEELVTPALSEYDLFVVPDATTALSSSRRGLVRKYQDTIQNAYLPRPPQAPAAHFKRLYRK